jgi:predicted house-cleaning noncanonical NTP pyrophosphatase (MazG superfamily)
MTQSKLVRDKVPAIIRASGDEPKVHVARADEYVTLLRAKLLEEVDEFLSSNDPEELADILQVLLALAENLGIDHGSLEKMRSGKESRCGGFVDRIVWSGNR